MRLEPPALRAAIDLTVQPQHLLQMPLRHPPRRSLAEPAINQTLKPSFLVAVPITRERALRHAQQLASLHHRQFPGLPAAQNITKLLHPAVLWPRRPVHRFAPPYEAKNRTTRVLPNPDNSCAYDPGR